MGTPGPADDDVPVTRRQILRDPKLRHMLIPARADGSLVRRAEAALDFLVDYRVTDQPLLAIEVDGFAFHENDLDQRARDARKDAILDAHQMPLLRLPTTGSREHQQIRRALDNAEAHWARMSTR